MTRSWPVSLPKSGGEGPKVIAFRFQCLELVQKLVVSKRNTTLSIAIHACEIALYQKLFWDSRRKRARMAS